MAWAEKRADTWRAAWRDGNGQLHRKSGFTHKPAALKYAYKQEEAAQGLSAGDPKATFGQWLDVWLKNRSVEASTDKKDRERVDTHVRPQWGDVQIRRVTRLAAETWLSELDEILSPWTVRRIWFNFATPLRYAHEHGAGLPAPFAYMLPKGTLPTPAPGHERYLPRAKLDPLIVQLPAARDLIPALLLLGTGMRWGEMAGLHREKVDLGRRVVHILETWDRDGGGIKGYPKSKQARDVPLPDWLCEELRLWFSTEPDGGTCGLTHQAGTLCQSSLVMAGVKGRPLNREHYASDVLKPALARIGVQGFRIHDTRHTYASWLLQAGRSIAEVSELLGHHSIVVTQKYTHLGGTHWDGVRDALEREQKGSNGVQDDQERSRTVMRLVK